MILTEAKRIVKSNFGENRKFGIALTSKTFKMLSSDVYTYKERAVIRELSCNAIDAHIEAGTTVPYDVHLPTHIEPWFSIRDYGTGISEESVYDLYTIYGDSTKTDSNEVIGALGIGSKSPLCLASEFTVISYFQGTKSTYSCFLDDSGIPSITKLASSATSEPNGLFVKVLVDSISIPRFQGEAVEVYKYMKEIPNINIDSVVEKIQQEKDKFIINGDGYGFTGSYGDTLAVMGGVAYEVPLSSMRNFEGYIEFPIGSFDFNPGRETASIENRDVFDEKMKEVCGGIEQYVVNEVEKETTKYKKYLRFRTLSAGPLGRNISQTTRAKYTLPNSTEDFTVLCRFSSNKRVSKYTQREFSPKIGKGFDIFLNEKGCWHRVREYARESGKYVYVMTQAQILEIGIDKEVIRSYTELPKVVRSKSASGASRSSSPKFFGIKAGRWDFSRTQQDVIIPGSPYVVVNRNEMIGTNPDEVHEGVAFMSKNGHNPVVFGCTEANEEFLIKNGCVKFSEYFVKYASALPQAKFFKYDKHDATNIERLYQKTGINRLKSAVDMIDSAEKNNEDAVVLVHFGVSTIEDDSVEKEIRSLFEEYPILTLTPSYYDWNDKKVATFKHYFGE